MGYLALDVGERRVGLALSQAGTLAAPWEVLVRTSKARDFERIAGWVRQQGVDVIVVGHPLNDDGSAGPQAQRVERYAAALDEALRQAGLAVDVVLWDERNSTLRAQAAMIEGGRSARTRRQRIDAAAAAVILQDYLDAQAAPGDEPEGVAWDAEEETG